MIPIAWSIPEYFISALFILLNFNNLLGSGNFLFFAMPGCINVAVSGIYLKCRLPVNCLLATYLFTLLILLTGIPGIFGQSYFSFNYDINNDAEVGLKISKSSDKIAILVGAKCNQNTTNCIELLRINGQGDLIWSLLLDTMDVVFFDNLVTTDSFLYVSGPLSGPDRFGIKVLKFDWEGNQIHQVDLTEQFPVASVNNLSLVDSTLVLTFNKRGNGSPLGVTPDTNYYYFMDRDLTYLRHYSVTTGEYRYEISQGLDKALDGSGYYSERWATNSTWLTPDELDLIKFDSLGNVLWTYTAEHSEVGRFPHLTPTLDGGVVLAWHKEDWETVDPIYPLPSKLIKVDTWGEMQWEYTFESAYPKELGTLFTAENGDIIGIGLEDLYDSPYTDYDFTAAWIFRMSPDGELLWERNLLDSRYLATDIGMYLYDGIELENGDLMFTGKLQDTFPANSPFINNPNTWVVRTDNMGCLIPGCGRVEVITSLKEPGKKQGLDYLIFPIPAHDILTILSSDISSAEQYAIYSVQGQKLKEGLVQTLPVTIDINLLEAGIYWLVITDAQGRQFPKTFVKQ
ncbi:MAG: hypothetical protein DHS20C18_18000 [Saprospiraceae bacterium]|nr:MAG: hypothetical protein DHS20C18_18000 [Saprospiraceae bacterium]